MPTYNGHKNWNHWNVSLWIANDEGLYRLALDCLRSTKTKRAAAERLIEHLQELNISETPDGAKYTLSTVLHALKGLE